MRERKLLETDEGKSQLLDVYGKQKEKDSQIPPSPRNFQRILQQASCFLIAVFQSNMCARLDFEDESE